MTTIRPIDMSFDAAKREDGWYFRYPSGDETANWFGPFINREAANTAALAAIEKHLAAHVADVLGLN